MRCLKDFPLDIVQDRPVVRFRGHAALIDVGSQSTTRAPAILSNQLGQPIRWRIGVDALSRHRILLDWKNRRAVIGGPELPGERLPLVSRAGLFQVELTLDHGSALAYLTSGISYAPPGAVRGLTPVAHASDVHPLFGEFNVPVYELSVRVGQRRINGRFGVLPPVLGAALAGVGRTGWMLGSDFFRDRAILIDFANSRVIDATVETPRQRTTPRPAMHGADGTSLGDRSSFSARMSKAV